MPVANRIALRALAALYLVGILVVGVGWRAPGRVLPRTVTFFLDVAALFPEADEYVLEYRAQAWVCAEGRWAELDTRPYFPLNADNKESRFQRAMLMFHHSEPTLRALDAFLVQRHAAGDQDDGIGRARRVGGVRLIALRIPLPKMGEPIRPFGWRPLAGYPDEVRHVRYQTPRTELAARCTADSSPGPAPPSVRQGQAEDETSLP